MWTDTLDLGNVRPLALIDAVPGLLQRLAAVRFSPGGEALVDGAPLAGLRLVSGEHFRAGAAYALVVEDIEADGDVDHDAVFVSIEAFDTSQLVVLVVTPKKHAPPEQRRLTIADPTAPSRLVYSQSQTDGTGHTSTLHLDVDIAALRAGRNEVATLDMAALNIHAELTLGLRGQTTVAYTGRYVSGEPAGTFAGLKKKATEKAVEMYLHALLKGWKQAAGATSDPATLLWTRTIGRLAIAPKKQVVRFIEETLAA